MNTNETPTNPQPPLKIFIQKDGEQLGPYSIEEVMAKEASGEIRDADLAWTEGQSEWQPYSILKRKIPALVPITRQEAPPKQKASDTIAGIVVLLLVWFGFQQCSDSKAKPKQNGFALIQDSLDQTKQQWFEFFHPVGTANRVVLHDAQVSQTSTGPQMVARFTVYWSSPLVSDGFTKIKATHDRESQRWVRGEVLESNGVTTSQVAEGVGAILGGLLLSE